MLKKSNHEIDQTDGIYPEVVKPSAGTAENKFCLLTELFDKILSVK